MIVAVWAVWECSPLFGFFGAFRRGGVFEYRGSCLEENWAASVSGLAVLSQSLSVGIRPERDYRWLTKEREKCPAGFACDLLDIWGVRGRLLFGYRLTKGTLDLYLEGGL